MCDGRKRRGFAETFSSVWSSSYGKWFQSAELPACDPGINITSLTSVRWSDALVFNLLKSCEHETHQACTNEKGWTIWPRKKKKVESNLEAEGTPCDLEASPQTPRVTPGPHVVNLIAYSWIVSAGIVVLIILLCSLQAMSMILPWLFMGFLLIPGKLPITDERLTMGPINTGHNHR